MAKARVHLTKRMIDAMEHDPEHDVFLWDDDPRGLGVRMLKSGVKVFVFRYGDEKKRRLYMIDTYGPMTLEKAREKVLELKRDVKKGVDPIADRKESKKPSEPPKDPLTFKAWTDEYLVEITQRKKSTKDDKVYLKMAVEAWGVRPLDSITIDDVEKKFRLYAATKKTAANRWLASIRACFAAAWLRDLVKINPAARIRKNPENPPRARVLSDEELRRVLKALDTWPDPFEQAAFLLLISTGARLSEVLRAKWADIDLSGELKTWRLPSPKAGYPQTIPLPPGMVTMLEELPRLGAMVIPGRHDPDKRRFDLKNPWEELRKVAGLPDDVHIHDLRRTYGLRVAREVGLHVASKLLRHSDVRITERVYAPLGMAELATAAAAQAIAMDRAMRAAEKAAKKKAKAEQAASAPVAVGDGGRVLPMRSRGGK